jgi:hypothetical protein
MNNNECVFCNEIDIDQLESDLVDAIIQSEFESIDFYTYRYIHLTHDIELLYNIINICIQKNKMDSLIHIYKRLITHQCTMNIMHLLDKYLIEELINKKNMDGLHCLSEFNIGTAQIQKIIEKILLNTNIISEIDLINLLIYELNFDINSLFFRAVETNNLDLVENLMDFITDINISNGLPLHLAIKNNLTTMAKYLLDNGANANQPNRQYLCMGICNHNIQIVKLLLENDIDLNNIENNISVNNSDSINEIINLLEDSGLNMTKLALLLCQTINSY